MPPVDGHLLGGMASDQENPVGIGQQAQRAVRHLAVPEGVHVLLREFELIIGGGGGGAEIVAAIHWFTMLGYRAIKIYAIKSVNINIDIYEKWYTK
jgi:hypothetical protein